MTKKNTTRKHVFTIGWMHKKRDEMVTNSGGYKKIHFEESQKNQHISSSTKSLTEMKDVHIEFDNMNNNDIQNGKLVYII